MQQLAIHTVGAAVLAAQPLMQIVPQWPTVEFEASIADRDVGSVREGQSATVKIDAFEYIHYGTVPAVVSHVSRDAIQDEKRGLLYTVTVRLERPSLLIDGQAVKLTPGMSGTVDVRTGTRRVIGYVLAPLLQTTREEVVGLGMYGKTLTVTTAKTSDDDEDGTSQGLAIEGNCG